MPSSIRVPKEILDEMLAHARRDPSRECCGLLAGAGGAVARVFPAANVAENPLTAYEIAPKEIFEAMRAMRAAGVEMVGIYHSHPNGRNEPSPRDVGQAYYAEAAYFIISPRPDAERAIRVFSIHEGCVEEIEIDPI